jgi:hypothetical protein
MPKRLSESLTLHERLESGPARSGAVVTIALLAALTLDACSSEGTKPITTNSSSSMESARPREAPTSTETAEPVPAGLEKYKEMTFTEFAALPRPEQNLYFSWLIRNLPKYVADYTSETKTATDIYTLPSASNTAQQALAYDIWLYRAILSMNPDDAQKAVVASHAGGTSNRIYLFSMNHSPVFKQIPITGQGLAAMNVEPIGTVTSASALQHKSDGTPFYDVQASYTDGSVGDSSDIHLDTFKDYNGADFSYWSQYE